MSAFLVISQLKFILLHVILSGDTLVVDTEKIADALLKRAQNFNG